MPTFPLPFEVWNSSQQYISVQFVPGEEHDASVTESDKDITVCCENHTKGIHRPWNLPASLRYSVCCLRVLSIVLLQVKCLLCSCLWGGALVLVFCFVLRVSKREGLAAASMTSSSTTLSKVHHEILIVAQSVKNFSSISEHRRFLTLSAETRQARNSVYNFLAPWNSAKSHQPLIQLPNWRTTLYRLTATMYSIHSQLPFVSVACIACGLVMP
jgi:hypothetical protein